MKKYIFKYKEGTYKRGCDRSGFDYRRDELIREPITGYLVHPSHYVIQNPIGLPWNPPHEKSTRIE